LFLLLSRWKFLLLLFLRRWFLLLLLYAKKFKKRRKWMTLKYWPEFVFTIRVTRLGYFLNIWLLFTWVFLKSHLNKQFQNTVFVLILTLKSNLMQLLLTFNLSFCNLATVLATFPKIGWFFSNFWSLCSTLIIESR
jgi:hypothetical protein